MTVREALDFIVAEIGKLQTYKLFSGGDKLVQVDEVVGIIEDARDLEEYPLRWEMSEKYPGYACCPVCRDTYINPEWILNMKWRYCPTCGTKLLPVEAEKNE